MFVVGVSGVARSGKNLFCDLIIEELAKQGYTQSYTYFIPFFANVCLAMKFKFLW